MKNVGLFFGSFNPVHNGHLMLANYLLEYASLDEIWFIVSPHNPLKAQADLMPEEKRLAMVKKAVEGFDRFVVSDIEFGMPKPSYTIDTLKALEIKFPNMHFHLITGTDSLENFHLWKDYEAILKSYSLLVYPRKGSSDHPLIKHPSVQLIEAPLIEVSSTFIRDAIKQGKDLRFFLPKGVFEMIRQSIFEN
ncbi:MAG: nicotinate-nucleotide adenylyltransferase [Bacteroidetes bacterium]|nr:MAG: nicotinate-nucleotide adenylyltransferase [Bacteroidota bacterium]